MRCFMKKKAKEIPIDDKDLLLEALTHRSWLNEHPEEKTPSNERLEFLGDAVLELVVTQYLFRKFPERTEGSLTSLRASLVRTETLAKVANALSIGKLLRLSHGEALSGGSESQTLLANTFEAVIGAVYLSKGKRKVEQFVKNHLFPELEKIIENNLDKDAKSRLQELVQSQGVSAPIYRVEEETGPDHNKTFTLAVFINGKRFATGTGKSKQQAQQQAAIAALEKYERV